MCRTHTHYSTRRITPRLVSSSICFPSWFTFLVRRANYCQARCKHRSMITYWYLKIQFGILPLGINIFFSSSWSRCDQFLLRKIVSLRSYKYIRPYMNRSVMYVQYATANPPNASFFAAAHLMDKDSVHRRINALAKVAHRLLATSGEVAFPLHLDS